MKKRFLMSAVCAAAISLFSVAPMNAQGGDGEASCAGGRSADTAMTGRNHAFQPESRSCPRELQGVECRGRCVGWRGGVANSIIGC